VAPAAGRLYHHGRNRHPGEHAGSEVRTRRDHHRRRYAHDQGVRPAPIENVEYVLLECTYGKFEDGLLTLFAPEAEAVKPKTIQVMSK